MASGDGVSLLYLLPLTYATLLVQTFSKLDGGDSLRVPRVHARLRATIYGCGDRRSNGWTATTSCRRDKRAAAPVSRITPHISRSVAAYDAAT